MFTPRHHALSPYTPTTPWVGPTPDYDTPAWHALPDGHPAQRDAMRRAADRWAALVRSPHMADLLAEWTEWDHRAALRTSVHAMTEPGVPRLRPGAPTYAELGRRRYPPDGDVHRWVAHGRDTCPTPPCWCAAPPPCPYPPCRRDTCHHWPPHTRGWTTDHTSRKEAA